MQRWVLDKSRWWAWRSSAGSAVCNSSVILEASIRSFIQISNCITDILTLLSYVDRRSRTSWLSHKIAKSALRLHLVWILFIKTLHSWDLLTFFKLNLHHRWFEKWLIWVLLVILFIQHLHILFLNKMIFLLRNSLVPNMIVLAWSRGILYRHLFSFFNFILQSL